MILYDSKRLDSFSIRYEPSEFPNCSGLNFNDSIFDEKPQNYEEKYMVYLKCAKEKDSEYSLYFPNSLLCQPYKYDLKISGYGLNDTLKVALLDEETLQPINNSCSVESLNFIDQEAIIRFSFSTTSYKEKKGFKILVTLNGKQIFLSTSFKTFARRKEEKKVLKIDKKSIGF